MLSRNFARRLRIFFLGFLTVSCAGCSDALLSPPGIPTGAAIATYHQEDFSAAAASGMDSRTTLISGIAYVDQQCIAFFDSVEQLNRKLKVGQSTFLTAGNQAQVLMQLANQSSLAIAKVAAAVEVTKVFLEQYQTEFAFAPHSVELRAIILQAMDQERRVLEQAIYGGGHGLSHQEAIYAVKRYAHNCTLGNITEQWNRAIAKAVAEGVRDASTGQSGSEAIDLETTRSQTRSVLSVPRYVVR